MNEHSMPSNERPSLVPGEIPSAVRSSSSRHTSLFFGIAAVALLALFLMKGGHRKNVMPVAEDAGPIPVPASQPSLPPVNFTTARPVSDGSSALGEIRRTSPILILNNSGSGDTAGGGEPTSSSPGLPMPAGFHPTSASGSHAGRLGDRTWIIAQGKLLDAVLETAINSDHPGLLRALIATDTYGDAGRAVLLPKGTRLIGQYDAAVAQGQNRVYVIWQRAIRPDGIDITLDSGGTDPLGQAGIEGRVNRHFFTMFGAATLLSVIGAAAATVGVQSQDADNSLSAYRSSIAQGFEQAAGNVLGVFVRIKPTIRVQPGTAIKVLVARDLYFDPALLPGARIQVLP